MCRVHFPHPILRRVHFFALYCMGTALYCVGFIFSFACWFIFSVLWDRAHVFTVRLAVWVRLIARSVVYSVSVLSLFSHMWCLFSRTWCLFSHPTLTRDSVLFHIHCVSFCIHCVSFYICCVFALSLFSHIWCLFTADATIRTKKTHTRVTLS